MQYTTEPGGRLFPVSDTRRTARNTKEDFHSSFSSFSEMHAAAHTILPRALLVHKERALQKETLSPPLFIQPITLSNGEGEYFSMDVKCKSTVK